MAHPDSSLFEQVVMPKLKELEYETRWHYFLNFNLHNANRLGFPIFRKFENLLPRIGIFEQSNTTFGKDFTDRAFHRVGHQRLSYNFNG